MFNKSTTNRSSGVWVLPYPSTKVSAGAKQSWCDGRASTPFQSSVVAWGIPLRDHTLPHHEVLDPGDTHCDNNAHFMNNIPTDAERQKESVSTIKAETTSQPW